MVDQKTVEKVAAAIDSVDLSHSMRLIRLVDGVSTYRLELDGTVEEFTDTDEDDAVDLCYARIRQVKQRKQAEAVIAALAPAPQPNVMPLEWGLDGTALTPLGTRYSVYQEFGRDRDCWAVNCLDGVFDSPELAKSAAQADYERRILSAFGTQSPQPNVAPQCCMCGKKNLSTVEGDGGTECELEDRRWVCSAVCWDRAVEPAPQKQGEAQR